MTDLAILMCHRVCDRTPATEPYFTRGTAVEPHVFAAQLRWLHQHCNVVSLADWAAGAHDADVALKPRVALTFDDGFIDCVTAVAPAMAALSLPWAMFPSTRFHGDGAEVAWTDHYYAILATRGHVPTNLAWLLGDDLSASSEKQSLRWWVRGPPKNAMFALGASERAEALERLAFESGVVDVLDGLARRLYCTMPQLRQLVATGADIGGHGASHQRLPDLSSALRDAELAESAQLMDQLGVGRPRLLCYPDGAHDADVRTATRRVGFDVGLTVEAGFARRAADPMQLPRFIVRNSEPSQSDWCAAFAAEPATRAATEVSP